MTWKDFLIQLSSTSAIMALVLLGLGRTSQLGDYVDLGWITWVVLILVTVLLFEFGTRAAASENKHTFLQLVIMSMLGKMMLAFFMALLYYQFTLPKDKFFVLPLFTIYFGFTIFETYLMMKLGKQKG